MLTGYVDEYIELLESFKKYQISALIAQISSKAFTALKNPKFNPKIASYFKHINEKGAPFTSFELDPDNVSQIKKVLNALYYAHITFSDLERINLKKDIATSFSDLTSLYQKTIEDAYKAAYLLTHLDVDVQELFQEELQLLYPIITSIGALIGKNATQTKLLVETFKSYPLSYKVGEVTGTAIEQIQPSNGMLDYKYLTQFSALLPTYIDKVTQYIQHYSSQLIAQEPTLNNAKLEELQHTALALLNDLEHLKGSGFFISLKFIKYIHIIRNIITLSMSVLEQIGHLSESSQDVIREHLAQLKYAVLPQLFGLVDKIEVNGMLQPGTLSIPLMEKVKPLYQTLIYYASKPVNFQAKGEELLSIEDSRFVALRLEKTYQRIDRANKTLFKIKQAEDAHTAFYELLNYEQYKNLALHQLPADIKDQLIEYYKIFKSYMSKVDVDLNKLIIDSLLGEKNLSNYLTCTWNWLTGKRPPDHISFVLAQQQPLTQLLTKKRNTQQFHIDLNTGLIESVQKETNLTLFPYSDASSAITTQQLERIESVSFPNPEVGSLYAIDESLPLKAAQEKNTALQFITKEKNKTIINPNHLTADQTLVLYQYYCHKLNHFKVAQKAYNEFIALLTSQIKELYPIPPHIIHFNHLQEANIKRLRVLYNIFKLYFIQGIPEEMKLLAHAFDQYLSPTNTTVIEPPVMIEFEKLNQHVQVVFTDLHHSWTQQEQFYLKQAKHKFASEEQNVFIIDESQALRAAGELNPGLKFSKEKGKKIIAEPEQLTANQALTLHQWYRNKRNKFEVARNAYNQFILILSEQIKKNSSPLGTKFTLHNIDKELKVECRKLYNLFQPYFVNGLPASLKQAALKFDRFLVHSFAEETNTENTPSNDLFEKQNAHFQTYFTEVDLLWRRKSQFYLKLAQEKFANEHENEPLVHDVNSHRAHYLIKHQNYSKFLYEFRQLLSQLTPLFNASMQAELNMQSNGIPFPELQDKYLAQAQSKQVLAVKELYNSLYHAEHSIRQLESLNDKSFKTTYVYYLIQAYSHIYEIIKLSKKLSEDAHFKLISNELLEKAQNIWATLQEHSEAYQESVEEVAPLDKKVQYSGLWYTLNAFTVIPKHISSLINTTYLTQDDLDQLHVSAKTASLTIEALINNSNSYFKLFLQTPSMLRLYLEFKSKLTEFIRTIHHTAISNLGEFHTHIFTPMLLEADQWEDKLGLVPGVFSSPLKQIIDQYYKGLLYPLKLSSKTHLQFICDKTPINERMEIALQKINDATTHLTKLDSTYMHVIKLHKLIEDYNQSTNGFFSTEPIDEKKLIVAICATYKAVLPKLVALKRQLQFAPNEKISSNDNLFDAQLNAGLKEYDPKLTDIKALVKLSHAHYLGLKHTYAMKLNTAKEQLVYLTQLSCSQDEANQHFVLTYTTESFDKQLEELANRHIGLHYVDREYCSRLRNYVLTFKEAILQQAKGEEDINLCVKERLKEQIRYFENEHFVLYYQLDSVRVALSQFKNYFSMSTLAIERNKSTFESETTLATKTAEINKLLLIAENDHLSVEDRLHKIKYQVINNPSFSRIILEQKQVNHFSFIYLKLCFLSLLEALHIYTPEKNARLSDLKSAVSQEPKISELSKRFGLFTNHKKTDHVALAVVKTGPDFAETPTTYPFPSLN